MHEAEKKVFCTEPDSKSNKKVQKILFSKVFENKENLLSLYNAMNHKNYTDADALQVVTLENSIYMGMKNDLAFILDMNLYLYTPVYI